MSQILQVLYRSHNTYQWKPSHKTTQWIQIGRLRSRPCAPSAGGSSLRSWRPISMLAVSYNSHLIKRAGEYFVAIRVKMHRNKLSLMPLEYWVHLSGLNVPQSRSVVHWRSCEKVTIGVELNCDNLSLMATKGSEKFASRDVPDLSCLVKWPRRNPVAIGNIKRKSVYCVFVAFQGMHKLSRFGVPYLAGSIVASSYKLIPVFIEAAVRQGKVVAFELFE